MVLEGNQVVGKQVVAAVVVAVVVSLSVLVGNFVLLLQWLRLSRQSIVVVLRLVFPSIHVQPVLVAWLLVVVVVVVAAVAVVAVVLVYDLLSLLVYQGFQVDVLLL